MGNQFDWCFDQERYLKYAQSVYKEAYGHELSKKDYCFASLLKVIKRAELHIVKTRFAKTD